MAAEGKVIIFHRCNLIFLFSQQRWKTMGSQPNLTSRSEVVSIYKCPPPKKKKNWGVLPKRGAQKHQSWLLLYFYYYDHHHNHRRRRRLYDYYCYYYYSTTTTAAAADGKLNTCQRNRTAQQVMWKSEKMSTVRIVSCYCCSLSLSNSCLMAIPIWAIFSFSDI